MADNPGKQSRTAAAAAHPGRLVVVTCADAGRLEVMLRAAACHMGAKLSAEQLSPLATRRMASGGGSPLKLSQFWKLESKGSLLIRWREGQHLYGYPNTVLERLVAGLDVVIGTPAHLEPALRNLWPETILIRFAAGTEPLRQRLTPQAMFARAAASGTRHGLAEPVHSAAWDMRVEDSSDPAMAVRRLSAAIANALPSRAVAVVATTRSAAPPLVQQGLDHSGTAGLPVPPARRRTQRSSAQVPV